MNSTSSDSTKPHIITYGIDQDGYYFSVFMFAFGIFIFFFTQYLLLVRYKNHPMLIVRSPHIFWFDISFNLFNIIVESAYNFDFFHVRSGCEPLASLSIAYDFASNVALVGRAVLFYDQAAQFGHIPRVPVLDQLIFVLALLTAPGEYFRDKIEEPFEAQVMSRKSVATAVSHSHEERRTTITMLDRLPPWLRKVVCFCLSGGYKRYVVLVGVWYVIGLFLALKNTTFDGLHHYATDPSVSTPLGCWEAFVAQDSYWYYYTYSFIFFIILVALMPVSDEVGLRNDILLSMALGVGFKAANAYLLQYPTISLVSWEYMYPLSAATPPLGSMIILVYYVHFVFGNSSTSSDTSSENKNRDDTVDDDVELVSIVPGKEASRRHADMTKTEALWRKPENGREVILSLAKKFYVLESIKFLSATDAIFENPDVESEFYVKLYHMFVEVNSPWEINISNTLRDKYTNLALKKQEATLRELSVETPAQLLKTIASMRKEVFGMLDPLFAVHLRKAIKEAAGGLQKRNQVLPV